MQEGEARDQGQRLLHALERFTMAPELVIARVKALESEYSGSTEDLANRRRAVADRLIKQYSNSCALTGGVTALPAVIPGIGTVATVTGGVLADMGLLLKLEAEMALSLSCAYGFDILDPRERQLAFLMASVGTYEAEHGGNLLTDLAGAQATAIWNYAPREISKLLVTVLTQLTIRVISRGFIRAIPLLGIIVGASANKVLTARVGRRIRDELERRRLVQPDVRPDDEDDVVEAKVDRADPTRG